MSLFLKFRMPFDANAIDWSSKVFKKIMSLGFRAVTEMIMNRCCGPADGGSGGGRRKQKDGEDLTLGRVSLADGRPATPRSPLTVANLPAYPTRSENLRNQQNTSFQEATSQ